MTGSKLQIRKLDDVASGSDSAQNPENVAALGKLLALVRISIKRQPIQSELSNWPFRDPPITI